MSRMIDADATLHRLKEWDTDDPMDKALYNFAVNRINEQPTIEERKGKWIFHQYDANPIIGNWHCSECGKITIMPHVVCNFCPHCGARMEVDNDS